jgi:hypothetical protein
MGVLAPVMAFLHIKETCVGILADEMLPSSTLLHVTIYETNLPMVQLSTLKMLIELQDFLGIFHS